MTAFEKDHYVFDSTVLKKDLARDLTRPEKSVAHNKTITTVQITIAHDNKSLGGDMKTKTQEKVMRMGHRAPR